MPRYRRSAPLRRHIRRNLGDDRTPERLHVAASRVRLVGSSKTGGQGCVSQLATGHVRQPNRHRPDGSVRLGRRQGEEQAREQEAPAGRGPEGKTAVVGAKDRETKRVAARVVESTDRETLQGFVKSHTRSCAKVYTDEASAYDRLPNRETVKHSVGAYVRGNGPHQRCRELLVDAQARLPRHLSPDEPQAPTAVRQRVRGPSQHPPKWTPSRRSST